MVTEQEGLNDAYSGVCGLARSKFKPSKNERGLGPLLVKQLAEAGSISSNVFAIYMDSLDFEN